MGLVTYHSMVPQYRLVRSARDQGTLMSRRKLDHLLLDQAPARDRVAYLTPDRESTVVNHVIDYWDRAGRSLA